LYLVESKAEKSTPSVCISLRFFRPEKKGGNSCLCAFVSSFSLAEKCVKSNGNVAGRIVVFLFERDRQRRSEHAALKVAVLLRDWTPFDSLRRATAGGRRKAVLLQSWCAVRLRHGHCGRHTTVTRVAVASAGTFKVRLRGCPRSHPWIRRLGAAVVAAVVRVAGIGVIMRIITRLGACETKDLAGRAASGVDWRYRRRLIHSVLQRCAFRQIDGIDIGCGGDQRRLRDVRLGDRLLA
jgi:hypothetical protein